MEWVLFFRAYANVRAGSRWLRFCKELRRAYTIAVEVKNVG